MCGRGTQTAASMQAALVALLLPALPVRAEQWGDIEPGMTTIARIVPEAAPTCASTTSPRCNVTLKEVLDHHPPLSPGGRAFCEGLLTQGDMLAVNADYFPHLLLWLVTTPWQARLMREALSRQAEVEAIVLSLREAQDLLTTVGDAAPATVYEAAAWLLAPPPEEPASLGAESA